MTELIWDGKYKDGKKVAPVRIALPFQTIETVNESAEDRKRTLDMFAQGKPSEWRNRLIWGDKKYVLPSLLPEFAGKVNLIYIDPPFNVGADFSFTATIPDNPETDEDETTNFVKEPSILEQKAYRDTWGRGLDSYLQWFYETAVLLHELLAEDGSIYVHLDYHVGHYVKTIMDEVFGINNFRSEIIWKRKTGRGQTNHTATEFGTQTDTILLFSKSVRIVFHNPIKPLRDEYIETFYKYFDSDGRRYRIADLSSPSPRPNLKYVYKGFLPPDKGWAISLEKMMQWDKEGRLYFPSSKDGRIQRKRYLDENEGELVQNLWDDISMVGPQATERLNYDTQKPEALLERIIKASSNEGDLVLDCFCGSGTTAAVAEKLGRKWITCDLGRFAIHTARKRLLQIPGVKPFVVQNLGKYERQQWQQAEFESPADRASLEQQYRHFILDLYHAEPVNGFLWLHGAKGGRMVHIGSVESPVALGDVKAMIQEFWKAVGKSKDIATNGLDVLGWEFAFDMNETAMNLAKESKVDLKFKRIPREVLEKKAVDAGDIKFFELAALDVRVRKSGKKAVLTLMDFIIPPGDVPQEAMQAITHWSQWIDYWAVDWNHRDDTFHNEWQSYRTKKNPKIETEVDHLYEAKGDYTIVIKVIDILGNDTTKAVGVKIS